MCILAHLLNQSSHPATKGEDPIHIEWFPLDEKVCKDTHHSSEAKVPAVDRAKSRKFKASQAAQAKIGAVPGSVQELEDSKVPEDGSGWEKVKVGAGVGAGVGATGAAVAGGVAQIGCVVAAAAAPVSAAQASAVSAQLFIAMTGLSGEQIMAQLLLKLSADAAAGSLTTAQAAQSVAVLEWLGTAGTATTATATTIPLLPIIAVGAAVLGVVGAGLGYKAWCDRKVKNAKKREKVTRFDGKRELFKKDLEALQKLTSEVVSLQTAIKKQEAKLDENDFYKERHTAASKVVVVVGPTGFGKSTFCHRMCGNDDSKDDLEEKDPGYFNVAEYGKAEPETTKLSKRRMGVRLTHNDDKSEFELSVVDTVGAYDDDVKEQHHKNIVAEYFSSCGGINMLCIFYKFLGKADANYKALLQSYKQFWGPGIRKHCVLIITHCDQSQVQLGKKYQKGLARTINKLRAELKSVFEEACDDIPVFTFGKEEESYAQDRKKLMLLLNSADSPFAEKYSCDNASITAPIDELLSKLEPMAKKQKEDSRKLVQRFLELKRLKEDIEKK